MKERWWTTPTEAENGKTIIVTGRDYLDDIISKGKFRFRVSAKWKYPALPSGMPNDNAAELLQIATDALLKEFNRDKAAYITGIYTGDGEREWVFYTKNLNIFNRIFNRALENIEPLPLEFDAEEDPLWEEYFEMRDITYVPENDDER